MDVNQAIDQANQTNMAIALTIIFVPLILIVAMTILAVLRQHQLKCPQCGNWRRNRTARQSVRVDNKATFKRIGICKKCGTEFTA